MTRLIVAVVSCCFYLQWRIFTALHMSMSGCPSKSSNPFCETTTKTGEQKQNNNNKKKNKNISDNVDYNDDTVSLPLTSR